MFGEVERHWQSTLIGDDGDAHERRDSEALVANVVAMVGEIDRH